VELRAQRGVHATAGVRAACVLGRTVVGPGGRAAIVVATPDETEGAESDDEQGKGPSHVGRLPAGGAKPVWADWAERLMRRTSRPMEGNGSRARRFAMPTSPPRNLTELLSKVLD